MEQDRLLVEELNASFLAAFNKGDMQAIANMYTEGAHLLPPNAEMVRGRSGIEVFWRKIAEAIGDLKLTTIDVERLGSEALREVGAVSAKSRQQPAQEIQGKYVVIWRKVGGEWKLATDIWNMNK
jgi:uncharacterized protein (TIGR02246 family)